MKEKRAILVADLGYGDSGKGITIDTLARTYDAHTVVRYNGGPQAAHRVVTIDGRSHTFSQFGSATFVPGVATYLSQFMLVDPVALINEETYLQKSGISGALLRHFIHRDARVISPYAVLINKLRERKRDDARHGSCGMGVGETVQFSKVHPDETLYVRDLQNSEMLQKKLSFQREYARGLITESFVHVLRAATDLQYEWNELSKDTHITSLIENYVAISKKINTVDNEWEAKLMKRDGVILFEGAQGILLDERYGFHPFTTWSDTTFGNAHKITAEHEYTGACTRLGVLRAYATRHGPGPFVTYDSALTERIPDSQNVFSEWQREFRVGWFDAVASRFALSATQGVDALAITNIDRLVGLTEWNIATHYKTTTDAMRNLSRLPAGRGGIARDIVRMSEDDDELNEDLAKELLRAAPVYETVKLSTSFGADMVHASSGIIEKIEHELGVGVALLGFGPTSDEKYWRKPLF